MISCSVPGLFITAEFTVILWIRRSIIRLRKSEELPRIKRLIPVLILRKSLVCDMVEPFRCIIDRRLRKAYNLRQIDPADFFMENGCCRLAWKAQNKYIRLFFKDILSEKEKIFIFCQEYYRWFIRDKPMDLFPNYEIGSIAE